MDEKESDIVEVLFGFRKLILMLILVGISISFRLTGFLDGQQFVDLMKATTLGFFTANGFEHASLTVRDYMKNKGGKSDS